MQNVEQQSYIIDINNTENDNVDIVVRTNELKDFYIKPQLQHFDKMINLTLNEFSQTTLKILLICLENVNLTINLKIHQSAKIDVNLKCKCTNNDHIKCNIIQNHIGNFSESNVTATVVCDDYGRFELSGRMNIPNNINEISASQYGKGLLLSDTAHIRMSPCMQVASKNVLCNHGFAIGGIDQNELIFCNMRGIQNDLAKEIISNGRLEM
jgi:hypothetical protein